MAEKGFQWAYDIPLLSNRYMLWDMGRVFFATFVIGTGILLFATGFDYSIISLALLSEAIFIGLFLFVALILGNHIRSGFIVDEKGIGSRASRRMSKLNKATIVLGLLSGSASTAGVGFLASSKEQSFHPWNKIEKATVDKARRVISFHNSWRTVERIYCHEDSFEQILNYVSLMLPGKLVYGSRLGGS